MSVPLTADEQKEVDRILGRFGEPEPPDVERLYAEWAATCGIEFEAEAETEAEQLARVTGVAEAQAQHALDAPGTLTPPTPADDDGEREELWNAWEAWVA